MFLGYEITIILPNKLLIKFLTDLARYCSIAEKLGINFF